MEPTTEIVNRDLLASCWTSAGDAAPFRGDEVSPLDLQKRIETAARTGWKGFGVLHSDLVQARESFGLPALARMFEDNGIEHVEVEFLVDWWSEGPEREASDRVRSDLLEAAPILGARNVKVGPDIKGRHVEHERLVEEFDRLATEAGRAGTCVALEPIPMTNLKTIKAGADIVTAAGNKCGGLVVDIWHAYRGGTPYRDLLDILRPEYVFVVELNDAAAQPVGDLWADSSDHRLWPGDGAFDVPAFVATLHQLGYRGIWGVEIISEAHRKLPLDEALAGVHRKTVQVLEAAERLLAADSSR